MHPVLPSTMVLGPAALAIIFISRADSQPWHVRCPEVKNSSSGIFLTDLKGSSFWVGSIFTNVAMASFFLSDGLKAHQQKFVYSRNPIHWVRGCDLPAAAW